MSGDALVFLLHLADSLEEISSKIYDVRAALHAMADNVLAYVIIRPGVVAEIGAGSNYANRRSMQDARGRKMLMF